MRCCNLRNQEGADRFRAEVVRLGRSRVADMAETNLSGNGVMGNRQKDEALQE